MANLKITLVHGLVHSTERQRANVGACAVAELERKNDQNDGNSPGEEV